MVLIYLDSTVYFSNESVSCVEADRSGHQPERDHHKRRVPEVQQRRDEICDLRFSYIVEYGVDEDVDG